MTGIHIERPWLIFLGLIISAAVSFFYYYKDHKFDHVPRAWIFLMALLRFVALFLLFLLLSNPLIKSTLNTRHKPIVVLLQDNTQSISLATDSAYTALYKKKLNSLVKQLSTRFDLRMFTFSDSLRQQSSIDFRGSYTNISQALSEINQRFLNQNLVAIILATDGIYNQGYDPSLQASQSPVPIYSIALGDTTQYTDIRISRLQTNSIVFLHEKFPLNVDLEAIHATGKKITVQVKINGRKITSRTVHIDKDFFNNTLNFVLKASTPGKKLLTVSATPVTGERNRLNNTATTIINVIDSRQKILILSSFPHPDIATIRRTLHTIPTYKIDFAYLDKFKGHFNAYDLIVLYQLPDDRTNALALRSRLQSAHKPILLLCGPRTDGLKLKSLNTGLDFDPIPGSVDQAQGLVNKDFDIFLPPRDLDKLLMQLPPLIVAYMDYRNVQSHSVLLWQNVNGIATNRPLIMFIPTSPLNDNKLGIICGEGLWRWRMTEFRNTKSFTQTDQLVTQIVQFLLTTENKKRFRVKVSPVIDQNQEVVFTAELYDKSYNPVTEPDVKLTLRDSAGNVLNYIFTRSTDHYTLNIGKLEQGIYHYSASCHWRNESFNDQGSFAVRSINIEAINLKADIDLLKKIASFSGGKFFLDKQVQSLENKLLSSQHFPSIITSQVKVREGIRHYIFLILIIVSLSLEWGLRKYFGNL